MYQNVRSTICNQRITIGDLGVSEKMTDTSKENGFNVDFIWIFWDLSPKNWVCPLSHGLEIRNDMDVSTAAGQILENHLKENHLKDEAVLPWRKRCLLQHLQMVFFCPGPQK